MAGGLVKYPFSSDQEQQTNKQPGYDDDDDDRSLVSSRASYRSTSRSRSRSRDEKSDIRTHSQKAAAVTTGIISVAVGLLCAENSCTKYFY